ncbi:MAG: hypothetical protein ACR2JC_08280 [Chloroflexota bacterium]
MGSNISLGRRAGEADPRYHLLNALRGREPEVVPQLRDIDTAGRYLGRAVAMRLVGRQLDNTGLVIVLIQSQIAQVTARLIQIIAAGKHIRRGVIVHGSAISPPSSRL